MRTRLMIASAAAAALFAGAALAQNDTAVNPPSANQASPGAAGNASQPSGQAGASPSSDAATVAPAAGAPAERSPSAGGPTVITNGPVPDTKETRARYGQPLSAAGRRTRPAGN